MAEYTVKAGDTLSEIAAKQKVTVSDLVAANEATYPSLRTDPDTIHVGWVLTIPDGTKPPLGGGSNPPAVVGYYQDAYGASPTISNPPPNPNFGATFNGHTDPDTILQRSARQYDTLPAGGKYITVGGGGGTSGQNLNWTASAVQTVESAIQAGRFTGKDPANNNKRYDGLVFDVEYGDVGLGPAFVSAFSAARSMGLQVIVTVSGSAPWHIDDAKTLMTEYFFLPGTAIDALSPQLYGSDGKTLAYQQGHDVSWSDWQQQAKHPIVASIPLASMYDEAKAHCLTEFQLELSGYIQWLP